MNPKHRLFHLVVLIMLMILTACQAQKWDDEATAETLVNKAAHVASTSTMIQIVATLSPTPQVTMTKTPGVPITPSLTSTMTPSITPTLIAENAPDLPALPVFFVTHGHRFRPYVALTFDVCQSPTNVTELDYGIYETLVAYNAPATFFLTGLWMRDHPEETRMLYNNPLIEIGNHSWSHPDLRDRTLNQVRQEVRIAQDVMYSLTGYQTNLFRLPGGTYTDEVLDVIASTGMYIIQWDVITGDPDQNVTADYMLNTVKNEVMNGSIIIMHANQRGWNTAEALPEMIEFLRAEGYTLVTISQLIELEPYPLTETP